MLMAWRSATETGESDVIHAAETGSSCSLCGEPVDKFGPDWPFPQQEWAEMPEGRERCRYCSRLVYEG